MSTTLSPRSKSPDAGSKSSFKIGNRVAPGPLVLTEQLQAHLRLLKAFKDLKDRVQQRPQGLYQPALSLNAEKRWVWFLYLAVERFRRWVQNGTPFLTKESFFKFEIPPLDVWIVWHSYMLNPMWYAEDCARETTLSYLKWLNEWDGLIPEVLAKIEEFSSTKPTPSHTARWFEVTRLPFDPYEASHVLVKTSIPCPECSIPVPVPYLEPAGKSETGYAQIAFRYGCPECKHQITKASLAVAKFARDVTKDPSNISDLKCYGSGVYLPGTLKSPVANNNETRARDVKNSVAGSPAFLNSQLSYAAIPFGAIRQYSIAHVWEDEIKRKVEFSIDKIRVHMSKVLRPALVSRILSAYSDDRPFSVDLVGAALRQGIFVEKMHELGWTDMKFFETQDGQLTLHHCVARYHAFLDLMSSSSSVLFVPTLDIDLVWHTHQLCPERYASDCMTYIRRYVDHDDKVEESYLATSFDITCRAWQQRFGIHYMHCGCPLPSNTLGLKLSRITAHMTGYKLPITPPAREDCLLGTHPSDHNSIYVPDASQEMRQKRIAKNKKRRDRDWKKIEEGKMEEKLTVKVKMHPCAFAVPAMAHYPVGHVEYTRGSDVPIEGCSGVVFGGAIDFIHSSRVRNIKLKNSDEICTATYASLILTLSPDMKDLHTDANFPRTGDGRVYHLGLKSGEVANRIIAVGSPSRALIIAKHLDASPVPFKLTSERGFTTITGRYKGVPISVVSTGMGGPNTDFFVREVRESLSGDMLVVRLGSCGALLDIEPGSLVIPKACVGINRNWDYDFVSDQNTEQPYIVTKPVSADPEIYDAVFKSLEAAKPEGSRTKIVKGIVNASADSFYSSQGRQTSFPDHNEYLIPHILKTVPDLGSLEMETFHLYHLARSYVPRQVISQSTPPPLATSPVAPSVESGTGSSDQSGLPAQPVAPPPRIRVAAAQMVFAARLSQGFITPDEVIALETWSGLGILDALTGISIPDDRVHDVAGSVWEFKDER